MRNLPSENSVEQNKKSQFSIEQKTSIYEEVDIIWRKSDLQKS